MKQFIEKLKKVVIILLVSGVVLGGVFIYLNAQNTSEYVRPEISATSTTVEVVTEYTDMYNDLVIEILEKEDQYWKDKARLSAERQASEQIATQFSEQADAKKIEEQSL